MVAGSAYDLKLHKSSKVDDWGQDALDHCGGHSVNYAAGQMTGRMGRGPLMALKTRQYRDRNSEINECLRLSLLCICSLTLVAPPRQCLLNSRPEAPVILYTDAACD